MLKKFFLACGLVLAMGSVLQAQSLKDILNSEEARKVMNGLKEANMASAGDLVGRWQYRKPACCFRTEEAAHKLGAVALEKGLESELEGIYGKLGMTAGSCSYTFNSDSTFVSRIGRRQLKGRYSYDSRSGRLQLRYLSFIPIDVQLRRIGSRTSFLFKADHLLRLMEWLFRQSDAALMQNMGKLAAGYDGMLLGYDVERQ